MKLTATNTFAFRNSLLVQQGVLSELLNGLYSKAGGAGSLTAKQADTLIFFNKEIEKIKQVLKIVENGLAYFEATWIDEHGELKKFRWWAPADWARLKSSVEYYGQMFENILEVYGDKKELTKV